MSESPVVLEGRFTALSANVVYLEGAKFWIEGLDADVGSYVRLPPLLGRRIRLTIEPCTEKEEDAE